MILTNCTNSPRGLTLSSGVKILEAREMWQVPQAQRDEIRSLFKSPAFARFADNGVFRLGTLSDDEQSLAQKTPEPPQDLTDAVHTPGLAAPTGVRTGERASAPKIIGYQTAEAATTESATQMTRETAEDAEAVPTARKRSRSKKA